MVMCARNGGTFGLNCAMKIQEYDWAGLCQHFSDTPLQKLWDSHITRERCCNSWKIGDFLEKLLLLPPPQNLMCAGAVVRTVESEPALLSETLVLVRLTPSMGVLIAAILHKLSIEFLPKCAFFPSPAHTAVTLHEMSVSSHSLFPRCPSARFCPPRSSHFPFFLSVSHLSLLNLRGQLMNGFPALIGWCMMLLGGMKANITQRVWNGKGEESERVETEKCFDRRLWKQKDLQRRRCMRVTMGVGHSFTDVSALAHFLWEIVLQISSLYPLPRSGSSRYSVKKTGRLRSAPGHSQRSVCDCMWGV